MGSTELHWMLMVTRDDQLYYELSSLLPGSGIAASRLQGFGTIGNALQQRRYHLLIVDFDVDSDQASMFWNSIGASQAPVGAIAVCTNQPNPLTAEGMLVVRRPVSGSQMLEHMRALRPMMFA